MEERVAKLEERVTGLEEEVEMYKQMCAGKNPLSWAKLTPKSKLDQVHDKSIKFFLERDEVLEFIAEQKKKLAANDPDNPPVSWKSDKGVVYTTVKDCRSLYWLAKTKVGPQNLTLTFRKVFKVLLLDKKLVPLSRAFKGGIGPSLMWSEYDDLPAPASSWAKHSKTNLSKKTVDPRIGIFDPSTREVWKPEESGDEEEEQEEEEEESSDEAEEEEEEEEESADEEEEEEDEEDESADEAEEAEEESADEGRGGEIVI